MDSREPATITGDIKALDDRVRTLELAGREYYDQTKTGVTITTGTYVSFGSWPSSGGFTSSTNGVKVTRAGIYVATLLLQSTVTQFVGRTMVEFQFAGSLASEFQPDTNMGNSAISAVAMRLLAVGDEIAPLRYTTPNTLTACTVRMTIASL